MADAVRDLSTLFANLADGQAAGAISPQDVREAFLSSSMRVAALADLRSVTGADGQLVTVLGGVTAGDGFGALYQCSASSTSNDDGLNTILGNSRWNRIPSPGPLRRIYGLTEQNTKRTRKAIANVVTGTAKANIACVGDSHTTGFRAGTASADSRADSYPTRLAALLTAAGVPAQANSIWCTNGNANPTAYLAYDPRVTNQGAVYAGFSSLAGDPWGMTSGNGLDFAPGVNFDTVDAYTVTGNGTGGDATVAVDAQATQAITMAAASNVTKTTLTFTSGATAKYRRALARTAIPYLVGMDCYTAGTKQLGIWNMGRGGWQASNLNVAVNPADPLNALVATAPDVVLLEVSGVNEMVNATSVATYTANVQAIITRLLTLGCDIWMVIEAPIDTSFNATSTQANQDAMFAAARQTAMINGLPMIDVNQRFVSYTFANTNGFQADQLHPGKLGYHIGYAALIAQALLAA